MRASTATAAARTAHISNDIALLLRIQAFASRTNASATSSGRHTTPAASPNLSHRDGPSSHSPLEFPATGHLKKTTVTRTKIGTSTAIEYAIYPKNDGIFSPLLSAIDLTMKFGAFPM